AGGPVPARVPGGERMTATAVARHAKPVAASPLTGVGTLLALAVRRDRVRLSLGIGVVTLSMVYAPNALKFAYPEEAQRIARVTMLKTPPAIMLGGPFFGGNETT